MVVWPALALDVICILVFAIVGRSSHAEASDLLGVLHTAWPFLAGCLAGTVIGRTWRHAGTLRAAIPVWLATVALGMTLRVLTGDTIQLSFIIVATIVLGLLFFGWRTGLRLIRHARRPKTAA